MAAAEKSEGPNPKTDYLSPKAEGRSPKEGRNPKAENS
jgi:hypothetical protein